MCRSMANSRESLNQYWYSKDLVAPLRPRTVGEIEKENDKFRKEIFRLKMMLDDYRKQGKRRYSGSGPEVKLVIDFKQKLREQTDKSEMLEEKLDFEVHRYQRILDEKDIEMKNFAQQMELTQKQMELDRCQWDKELTSSRRENTEMAERLAKLQLEYENLKTVAEKSENFEKSADFSAADISVKVLSDREKEISALRLALDTTREDLAQIQNEKGDNARFLEDELKVLKEKYEADSVQLEYVCLFFNLD